MGGWNPNWNLKGGPQAALSLKLPGIPVFWAFSVSFGPEQLFLGVSGDNYFIDRVLVSDLNLHWFIGLGGYVNFGVGDVFIFSFGARLPIGISWQPFPLLEVFLDIAPQLGVQLAPTFDFPAGGWPVEIGVRLWL